MAYGSANRWLSYFIGVPAAGREPAAGFEKNRGSIPERIQGNQGNRSENECQGENPGAVQKIVSDAIGSDGQAGSGADGEGGV
jgi:hypothetical protein